MTSTRNGWNQEKKTLQEMADEHAMAETSEGSFEWTQEMTDQYIAEYEQTLEDIKMGFSYLSL